MFTCTLPTSAASEANLLSRNQKQKLKQRQLQKNHNFQQQEVVEWRRNGRKLSVKWLSSSADELEIQSADGGIKSRFVARQIWRDNNSREDSSANVIQFNLIILRADIKDDNSTFSCLYKYSKVSSDDAEDDASGASQQDNNNNSGDNASDQLAHESNLAQLRVYSETINNNGIKLDVNLGPPIDNLVNKDLYELNRTTSLQVPTTHQLPNQKAALSLRETLANLYELIRPTLILSGCLLLIAFLILNLFLYFKRRSQFRNQSRYMKHCPSLQQQYSISSNHSNGSSSNGSSSLNNGHGNPLSSGALLIDPVLTSLIGRTLSAGGANHNNAAHHLSGSNGQLNGAGGGKKFKSYRDQLRKVAATNDYLDANFILSPNQDQEPFFISSGQTGAAMLPNLYNQSLAAREQARSLLQGQSDHMRSLNNLNNKHFLSGQQAPMRNQQNGSHLNLPLSFAFNNQWSQQQQLAVNQLGNFQSLAANTTNEHYQLVNCSSISPSSASSSTNECQSSNSRQQKVAKKSIKESVSSSNHYSTIANEDEDNCYEEVDCQQQHAKRKSIGKSQYQYQDQLSPYAVSSICNNVNQQQQPPVNSEAMRALSEQFDINQLMLLDEQFQAPPPPEDPPQDS